MSSSPRTILLLLAIGVMPILAGCPAVLPPNLRDATVKPNELPGTVDEIVRYADEQAKLETTAAAQNVIVAVDHGLGKEPRSFELIWRGARACAWLTEEFTDKARRASYAQKGVEYAKRGVEIDPKRVEAHYYLGINIGQSATTKTVGAYMLVGKVVKAAQAARKIDEHFDHAGPARLLGAVYAKAPPWPASVGDIDEGIKHLSSAVALAPEYPQNHLFYGDALRADGKLNEAAREYKLVLNAPLTPEWAHRAERWRSDATAGMNKIAATTP